MVDKIYELISLNRHAEAIQLLQTLDEVGNGCPDALALLKWMILSDIANETDDLRLADQAISVMSQIDADRLPASAKAKHWYNLGNAYGTASRLKRMPPGIARAQDADFKRAKNCYQRAMALAAATSAESDAPLYVNYGHLIRRVGRHVEEIESYDEALRWKPNFGMALWDKGKGLCWYSTLVDGHSKGTALVEARRLYRKARDAGVESGKEKLLERDLDELERLLEGIQDMAHPPTAHASESEIESRYIRFCVQNRLYLHPCPAKSHEAYRDPLSVRFPIQGGTEVLTLISENLAQLKREYVAARFLLFSYKERAPDLAFLDRGLFLSSFRTAEGNIYVQLLGLAFRSAYSILDKIAYFLHQHCQIAGPIRKVSFAESLFCKDNRLRPELLKYDGFQLAALYDVSCEFSDGQPLYRLRELRNALEHRCVVVWSGADLPKHEPLMAESDGPALDERDLTEDQLYADTTRLLRAVRAAVFYVHWFVRQNSAPPTANSRR